MGDVRVTELDNGFTIMSDRVADRDTASVGVWVNCGSRHEADDEHGLSHLIEHMAFKGTERRTARDIAEAVEARGGDINAATGLEHTCYYARVMGDDVSSAVDVFGDILLNSTFAVDELALEQDVIAQEIAASRDVPDDVVFDLFSETAYPAQSVGRTVLGTEEHVRSFTADKLRSHMDVQYAPGRLVLAAAGHVDHDALVAAGETHFGGITVRPVEPVPAARYQGGFREGASGFEQAHLVMGFSAPSFLDDDCVATAMFSNILGGGMASRLFQEVREKRGLCYSVYTFYWGLVDGGLFGVHSATGDEAADALSTLIADLALDLAQEGPTDAELDRAKAQMRMGLVLGHESVPSRTESMARQQLVYGRVRSKEERLDEIAAVSADDVRRCGLSLLRESSLSFTQVGSRAGDRSYQHVCERLERAPV